MSRKLKDLFEVRFKAVRDPDFRDKLWTVARRLGWIDPGSTADYAARINGAIKWLQELDQKMVMGDLNAK